MECPVFYARRRSERPELKNKLRQSRCRRLRAAKRGLASTGSRIHVASTHSKTAIDRARSWCFPIRISSRFAETTGDTQRSVETKLIDRRIQLAGGCAARADSLVLGSQTAHDSGQEVDNAKSRCFPPYGCNRLPGASLCETRPTCSYVSIQITIRRQVNNIKNGQYRCDAHRRIRGH